MPPASPYRALSPEEEAAALRQQAKVLSDQLAAINGRVAELEKKE